MLNFKFHYLSGWVWRWGGGGWPENEIKANSAQLKLELGNIDIFSGLNFIWNMSPDLLAMILKLETFLTVFCILFIFLITIITLMEIFCCLQRSGGNGFHTLTLISTEVSRLKKKYIKCTLAKVYRNYPYTQDFILINRKIRQQFSLKCKWWQFKQGFPMSLNDFLGSWIQGSLLKSRPGVECNPLGNFAKYS